MTLVVALVVVLVGLAFLAHTRPAVGTVYRKDVHGPSLTVDGSPRLRAPQFRLLVGDTRKTARWVKVNAAQYVTCSAGNRWHGVACSKFELHLPAASLSSRQTVLIAVGLAMVTVPLVAGVKPGGRHD